MYKLLQPHLCALSPTAKNLRVQLSGCKTIPECRNILDIISRMLSRIEGATIDPKHIIIDTDGYNRLGWWRKTYILLAAVTI